MSRAAFHDAQIVLALFAVRLTAAPCARLARGAFSLPRERDFGADRSAAAGAS